MNDWVSHRVAGEETGSLLLDFQTRMVQLEGPILDASRIDSRFGLDCQEQSALSLLVVWFGQDSLMKVRFVLPKNDPVCL